MESTNEGRMSFQSKIVTILRFLSEIRLRGLAFPEFLAAQGSVGDLTARSRDPRTVFSRASR
jgi:hypothetical protein